MSRVAPGAGNAAGSAASSAVGAPVASSAEGGVRAVTNMVSDGRFARLGENLRAEIVKHEGQLPSLQLHTLKDNGNFLG